MLDVLVFAFYLAGSSVIIGGSLMNGVPSLTIGGTCFAIGSFIGLQRAMWRVIERRG